jgi:hypothetical protein
LILQLQDLVTHPQDDLNACQVDAQLAQPADAAQLGQFGFGQRLAYQAEPHTVPYAPDREARAARGDRERDLGLAGA